MRFAARVVFALLPLTVACYGQPEPVVCSSCGLDVRPLNTTCLAVAPPPLLVEAQVAFPSLPIMAEPVALARPADSPYWYTLERQGRLSRFEDRADVDKLALVNDLTPTIDAQGDAGLVGAAFHPHFTDNGQLFLSYTAPGGTVTRSQVARFVSHDGGASFETDSRQLLLDIDQTDPERIHLNADLHFGPDEFLYAGFGDGGPQGDPAGHAQDRNELRGKILRIDVDHGEPYAVPPDNPFIETGGRPEIYAFGLRNPWRFTFDRVSGALWAGDVGLVTTEEIDRISPGDNLGWPIREGVNCETGPDCPSLGLAAPIATYAHDSLGGAVVGGFVYHGHAIAALQDRYVYADFTHGDVWALTSDGQPELIAQTGRRIVSFAEEESGELLVVDLMGGQILRLVPAPPSVDQLPQTLSTTGCFLPENPRQPAPGLVPYDVRVPFWADGAVKRRFFALPEGTSADIRPDGTLLFPVGSVLVKEFSLDSRPIETRLFMKYRDGQWAGLSYIWDDDGRDAHLAPETESTRDWGSQPWRYPSRAACLGCHSGDRGLGLEVAQLDLTRTYENERIANQLLSLQRAGLIEGGLPPVTQLPLLSSDAPLEDRARSYLHVNCAICHAPAGPTPVDLDLRFSTAFQDTRLCNAVPKEGDLGVTGVSRLTPGRPDLSLISLRMHAVGKDHMPPIGPQEPDPQGKALIDDWIKAMNGCP